MAATNLQYPTQAIQDATLAQTVALPASAGTVNTNAIDLGTVNTGPFPTTGKLTVALAVAASATNGVNVQTNVSLQTSADGTNWSNFTDIVAAQAINTNVAFQLNVGLDPGCLRYIRGQAVTTGGGNVSDTSLSVKVLM